VVRIARIVEVIKPAAHGLFGAQIVKLAFPNKKFEVGAYAKHITDYELTVELLTALIGRQIGLPIPEPVIAISLDGSQTWFASVDIKAPNLSQKLNITNGNIQNTQGNALLLQELANWQQIDQSIGFDEWIANDDRNTENILHDGKTFYLIDHNRAMRATFQPKDPISKNDLLNIKLLFHTDDISKQRMKNNIIRMHQEIHASLPKEIAQSITDEIPQLNSPAMINMVKFLTERLLYLTDLTNAKIQTKQVSI